MSKDNRCMYMAHVCFMSVVTVWSLWECVLCSGVGKDSGGFSLGVVKYVYFCAVHVL